MVGRFKRMGVSTEFRDFVLDQLARVPALRARRMFGGVGLYSGETFFAILAGDELYLKVDERTRPRYEEAGSHAFKPYADRPMTMAYWCVPLGVLEDAAELVAWAREAIGVSATGPQTRRRKSTTMTKRGQ